MRSHQVALVAALLAALAPAGRATLAQASPDGQPAAVADSFFRAQEQERWMDAARLMDLQAVGALRDQAVSSMRTARLRVHHVTPEELMRFDPKMPRVVAKYQAAKSNEQVGRFDWIRLEYADVPSADSLASLPVEEAAARWLEAKDTRYMMRRALAMEPDRCGVPDSVVAQAVQAPVPAYRTIGTVMDDSLAFVLYTQDLLREAVTDSASVRHAQTKSAETSYVMSPSVLTLRHIDGKWRIAPSFDMSNTGGAMIVCEPHPAARKKSH